MKRLSVPVWGVLLLLTFVFGCSGGGGGNDDPFAPLMGMLQFRIRYNLQDDSCLGLYDDNGQPKPGITDPWLNALP